jgi:transposase
MKSISVDLRKRVVSARLVDGQSMGEIAQRLQMPKASVQTILKHHQDTQTLEPKPHAGGRAPAFSGKALQALEAEVLRRPGATLEQLRDACGVKASVVAVHNTLRKLGYTRKKSLYVRASSDEKI